MFFGILIALFPVVQVVFHSVARTDLLIQSCADLAYSWSKHQLERELDGSRPVRIDWMKKGTPGEAILPIATCGAVVCGIASIAAHLILSLKSERRIIDSELRHVEDIERLGT